MSWRDRYDKTAFLHYKLYVYMTVLCNFYLKWCAKKYILFYSIVISFLTWKKNSKSCNIPSKTIILLMYSKMPRKKYCDWYIPVIPLVNSRNPYFIIYQINYFVREELINRVWLMKAGVRSRSLDGLAPHMGVDNFLSATSCGHLFSKVELS